MHTPGIIGYNDISMKNINFPRNNKEWAQWVKIQVILLLVKPLVCK